MIIENKPLISIVSPMYNVENYIGEFIECILAQTYDNWELLLVDDGSTDNTINVAKNYCDNRIFIYFRKNRRKGANACRNIGMEHAKGKYLLILDSDDLVEKICLEQRLLFMEQNKSIDYATALGSSIIVNDDKTYTKTDKIWGKSSDEDLLSRILSTDYPFGVWNNIYRLSSMKDCSWDEKVQIYQDFDFMVTTCLKNKKHSYIKESNVDYLYREGRPNAITGFFISEEKHKSTIYLFDKIQKSLKQLGNYKELHRKFKTFYILQLERLMVGGTETQYKEFFDIFITEYSKDLNIKIKILNLLFGSNIKNEMMNNEQKKVLLAHLMLFNKKQLCKVLYKKYIKH